MSKIYWNIKIVICESHHIPNLTYGKPYKVIYESCWQYMFMIKNDSGKVNDYTKEIFREPDKSELREIRLGELLDN